MKNDYKSFPPVMEGVVDTDLRFSLDYSSICAPEGSKLFFNKFGYFVVEGLPKVSNFDAYFDLVTDILKTHLKFNVEKKFHSIESFSNKNIDKELPKSDLVSCTVLDSNLKCVSLYIQTKNGEKHKVDVIPGRVITYDSSVKIIRYNPDLNVLHRWLNKFIPSDYYSNQYFLNYNFK